MPQTVRVGITVRGARWSRRLDLPAARIKVLPGRVERGEFIVPVETKIAWWFVPVLKLLRLAQALRLCRAEVEAPRA